MRTGTVTYPHLQKQTPSLLARALAAFVGGILLFMILSGFLMFIFQIFYLGRVYPGVHVAEIDLSGVRRSELESLLIERITYPNTGLIVLEDNGRIWAYTPAELGLSLDAKETAEAAYQVGRVGWPWELLGERFSSWRHGIDLPPQMILDERMTQIQLNEIAAQINRSPREASLRINGLNVDIEPGQVGRMIDVETTITDIRQQLLKMQDGSLALNMTQFHPIILDVSGQAAQAENILSQPLTLTVPGSSQDNVGPWTFDQETLASMLTIERLTIDGVEQYQLRLNGNKLYNFLYPLSPGLSRQPENARFIFNDETHQLDLIRPAVIGQELMIDASIEYINQELLTGAHEIRLVFDYTNPPVTDDTTAEDLGITELVSAQTTFFYGSSSSRIQNIKTSSSQFHGLLIPPGATFSMVENLGDIDLDSGYAEALIIYGDRTVKGVGGGVCQVSTTLFRTVFFGGFPVVERYSHAYRVYYYELIQSGATNEKLAGLDATVYAPLIDFKFTNDTPHWLLMETYVNEAHRSLTWKFYSTSDGRHVEWNTTGLMNVVDPPKPVFEVNDDLEKGEIKKVDWAVEGADVTITRIVWRDGQILFEDEFKTHYKPWATVCQYGPGTKDYPPPENKQQIDSCRPKKK